ncbi:MAG: hypothetical protein KatS3mg008_1943 [Acidimicrobiales bacterium]|nr:MAG: hypothetical protein KatS3mg008_1943 [Acidimicrobiales bacterium]
MAGSSTVVLMPVKAFRQAKRRLHPELSAEQRALLARQMADRVLQAAAHLPVAVVCDDLEVAEWATTRGALVLVKPGRGLNSAVEDATSELADMGYEEVIVAHGDLPHARDLTHLAGFGGVTLVPDRRGDGTNVICLPSRCGFRFSYGPGSFSRHLREASRLGLPVRVVREPELAWDVDTPEDLLPPPWRTSTESLGRSTGTPGSDPVRQEVPWA